jgi:hypothetical protein
MADLQHFVLHIFHFESYSSNQVRLMSMNRFLVADLTAHLCKEWPASFADVSYDDRGFLVAAFDARCAAAEGDVLGYMNKFEHTRHRPLPHTLCLTPSASHPLPHTLCLTPFVSLMLAAGTPN